MDAINLLKKNQKIKEKTKKEAEAKARMLAVQNALVSE